MILTKLVTSQLQFMTLNQLFRIKDAFGAEVHHREIVESDGVEEALIKVADSYIQLTSATTEDSPIANF